MCFTMSSRAVMMFLLCVTLLLSLAACAPAIETDESDWADAITLGSTESTSSTTGSTGTTESTGSSTTGSTKSSASSATTTASKTTSRSSATATSKTTVKTTGTTGTADISVGYVNASTLHVRSGPGSSYESIGGLQRGDQVTVTGRSGDWYVIRFGDTEAYVSAQYISSTPVE